MIRPGRCLQCLSMTLSLQNGAKIAWYRHWLLPQGPIRPMGLGWKPTTTFWLLIDLDIGVVKKDLNRCSKAWKRWIQRHPVTTCCRWIMTPSPRYCKISAAQQGIHWIPNQVCKPMLFALSLAHARRWRFVLASVVENCGAAQWDVAVKLGERGQ